MRKTVCTLLACLFVVIGFASPALLAQTSGGTIAGDVFDPSGALVPNAEITATGVDTGTVYRAVSTSAGVFHFGQMQLGRYNLTVKAAGFDTLELDGIKVTTGNISPAEAHLTTGANSQIVTVDADAPRVETENSEVSNTISTRQIVELPLSLGGQSAMRSVESFIFLAPGTVGPGTGSGPGNGGSTSGAFTAKTAGGQNFGTEELLDGISVRREDSNAAFDEHAPSIEALDELKVTTSIVPAAEGRTTGGVESFNTKSGTNSFHGTAFDIFQNEDLNANTYFNKLDLATNNGDPSNLQRPLDKKNDYGGSVGGPLSIPHLYNGHNRTFGFFSWEQFRQSKGGVATSAIPTAAVRGGDFSAQLTNTPDGTVTDCTGNPVYVGEILDPATTQVLSNGTPCRNPFPGNVIPTSRFSTVATNALKFLPLPNAGSPGQVTNNYVYATNFPLLNTNYSIRIDQNLSEKSKLFITYTDRDNDITNGNPPYPGPGGSVQIQSAFAKYLRVGNDWVFTPNMSNHFVAGLTRLYQFNRGNSVGFTKDFDALLGIKGASGPAFPSITFASNVANYNSLGYNNDSIQPVNALELSDSYTFISGPHTVSVGVDFRKDQFTNEDHGGNSGTFAFTQLQTSGAPNDTKSGDGFASLLLGQVNQAGVTVQSRAPRIGQAYYAVFAQDDFKVSKTLLLDIGLRYDIDKPRNEAHGGFSNFSPTLPNPGAGGLPGALYFAGNGAGRIGGSGEFAKTAKNDVAPRIGFAYAPEKNGGRTAFRGGFGIYYGPLDYSDFGAANQLGFSASPNFHNSDNFSQAFCNGVATSGTNTGCNGVNGFDQGLPAYTPPPNLDPTQGNGQDLGGQLPSEYIAPGYGKPARVLNWGLQMQQELAPDLIFTLGYIGTSASNLHSNLAQINDLNPANFGLGNSLNSALPTNVTPPFPGFSGTLAQALRPFPQYHNIYSDGGLENLGHSSYDALTVKLERRFHDGLNLLAAYTWSKTLTDADSTMPAFSAFDVSAGSVQNPYNLKSEKALSFQDTPHNFVVSYIYELPLGKGKKFLNHNPVVNAIVGGFQVGGIDRYLSGQAVSFSCTNSDRPVPATLACLRYNIAPDFVNHGPSAHAANPRNRQAFNIAAFTNPSDISPNGAYVLGTSPRVNGGYRGPGYSNEDFSIIKQVANFGEYGALQLHVDIFNAFNRVHFNPPDTTVTDAITPQHMNANGQFGSFQTNYGDPTIRQFILRYTF